ncbi:MAG: hypothetical protein IH949_09165 [Bacteroidetes bacterium]|nr:hypothetical protein [Bacteroidota bacterium]
MIKTKFEENNLISEDLAAKWMVDLYNLFKEQYTYYFVRLATEEKFVANSLEQIFAAQWHTLFEMVQGNLSEYVTWTKTEIKSNSKQFTIGNLTFDSQIDRPKVFLIMANLINPLLILIKQFTSTKGLLEAEKMALYNLAIDASKLPKENLEIIIKDELYNAFSKLSFNEKQIIGIKRRPYHKIIGSTISPIYKKHSSNFGNNRSHFLKKISPMLRGLLKLNKSELNIKSFERYIDK